MTTPLLFGLDTFGDMTDDDQGNPESAGQVIRNIVEQAVIAEQVGLDAFNIGEHHRDDFAVSAPDTVLAGIATRTERITLGTAVTVLSSDDPVRVYERFATVDALSNGRAEITAGRGSFTESFPLFGFNLADYHALFEEKLELLAQLVFIGDQLAGVLEGPVEIAAHDVAATNQGIEKKTSQKCTNDAHDNIHQNAPAAANQHAGDPTDQAADHETGGDHAERRAEETY